MTVFDTDTNADAKEAEPKIDEAGKRPRREGFGAPESPRQVEPKAK